MIKAVIFDIDGLMIDSESIQTKSFEEILKEYGKDPIKNENGVVHTVGASASEIWKKLKKQYDLSESEEILKEKSKNAYLRIFEEEFKVIKPIQGLLDLLKLLKKAKMKLAIATGGQHIYIKMVVNGLDIENYFDGFFSAWDVKRGKPYPDIFLLAAKKLSVKPEECLVLEDAESGVIAAHVAGMKVIAVPNKYTKNHDFAKADYVANSLKDINLKFINNL